MMPILEEVNKIRDGFKECCFLSEEDVSDIIEHLNVLLILNMIAVVYYDVRDKDFITNMAL